MIEDFRLDLDRYLMISDGYLLVWRWIARLKYRGSPMQLCLIQEHRDAKMAALTIERAINKLLAA